MTHHTNVKGRYCRYLAFNGQLFAVLAANFNMLSCSHDVSHVKRLYGICCGLIQATSNVEQMRRSCTRNTTKSLGARLLLATLVLSKGRPLYLPRLCGEPSSTVVETYKGPGT